MEARKVMAPTADAFDIPAFDFQTPLPCPIIPF